jgi:hypothetical protein
MRDCQKRTCSDGIGVIGMLFIWSIAISLTSGCSMFSAMNTTAKRVAQDIRSPHGNLKKKIGITFFENKTSFLDQAAEQQFLNDFVESSKKSCSGNILVTPADTNFPNHLVKLPQNASGRIDTLELSAASRRLGFNAIVTGAFTNIIKKQEEKGFWWFEDLHHFLEIHAWVEVYDTLTGAKLLDESFIHEMEIDETHFGDTTIAADLLTSITNEAFQDIASEMGEQVCDEIALQPWRGYITSVLADKIIISSGKTAGIRSGAVFEVFDSSVIFDGLAGQRFFVPGLKLGEIKVTTVSADRAEAIKVSGDSIVEGSFIGPK